MVLERLLGLLGLLFLIPVLLGRRPVWVVEPEEQRQFILGDSHDVGPGQDDSALFFDQLQAILAKLQC